ncbi:hypothetical protein [Pseudescherichia sp.]|uniref:hypothetical protein n=1 Tax=Pseudescherichia sp. TaxID=2055881 RepID=UPI0028A0A160|nr:hypothetical protein [Pseudescherichia sp.]
MSKNDYHMIFMDKFYTKSDYAQYCLDVVKSKIDTNNLHYFEPCVGTGAFYNLMPEERRSGYDIHPRVPGVLARNFLIQRTLNNDGLSVVVVSNPPFGRLSSMAVRFFNKCASFSDVQYICFIVPLTFRKAATQNKLNEYFHLIHDEDAPHKCFILDGNEHHVPCCFQIWEYRDDEREQHTIKNVSEYFTFCTKEQADIQIKRVGTKAGELAEPGQEHKDPSMYYIKTDYIDEITAVMTSDKYLTEIKKIRKTTAGVYCVSKSELVLMIEKYFSQFNDIRMSA